MDKKGLFFTFEKGQSHVGHPMILIKGPQRLPHVLGLKRDKRMSFKLNSLMKIVMSKESQMPTFFQKRNC